MVKVLRIDKCLICDMESISQEEYDNNKLPIEFNVVYCYKCVRKQLKKQIKNE